MYTHILVPLDGSDTSLEALPMAVAMARRWNASVELVHVTDLSPPVAGGHLLSRRIDEDEESQLRAQISYAAAATRRETGLRVVATFLSGDVVPVLRDHTRAGGADLIVMATHGRGGISRMWFGSVAEALVADATVPALLVRPGLQSAASRRALQFRHILVPLEHSPVAEDILPHVRALAKPGITELHLLTVIDPKRGFGPTSADHRVGLTDAESLLDAAVARAEGRLERVARTCRADGLIVHTEVTIDASPAQCIVAAARTHGVELIAMTAHGRHGSGRLQLDPVADKVIRGAYCPVLVARPGVAAATRSGWDHRATHSTPVESLR